MKTNEASHEEPALATVVRELRAIRELLQTDHAELLDARQAAALLGIGEATLYRQRAAGEIPQPVRIGVGTALVRWRRADLVEYIRKLRPGK